MSERLDVLAIAAHPDDAELAAGGTLRGCALEGARVGILDLTRGELGSRGTPELREQEADAAAKILGLAVRHNLRLPDGGITATGRPGVIACIRRWRPRIVMTHPDDCRHPDHTHASKLVVEACFYSGLRKVEAPDQLEPYRPEHVLHFAEVRPFTADFVVDVSHTWEARTRALQCYASQVHHKGYTPLPDEPETYISDPAFFQWIEARARTYGQWVGAVHGEPFQYSGTLGTRSLLRLLESA